MPIDGVVRRARAALMLVTIATAIAVGARAATSAADVDPPPPLVEVPGCNRLPPPPPVPTAVAPDGSSAAAPITLVIPPTVFVRVDDTGEPVAIMTNTGCAPRPSDRVLIEVDPFHATAPTPDLVDTVRALTFAGDWRETGGWHEV